MRLFVYGTLKRGGSNFGRFCDGATRIDRARVVGRLRVYEKRYPILEVPLDSIMARGSTDTAADVERVLRAQCDGERPKRGRARGGDAARLAQARVQGELMEFDDGLHRLPFIDMLEGYHANVESEYDRVMVAAHREDGLWLPAWTYVVPPQDAGRWPLHTSDEWGVSVDAEMS